MTIEVGAGGGGSPYPFPTMPIPLKDEGFLSDTENVIPHKGTLIDNIELPTTFGVTATGDYEGRLGASVIWTVTGTDLNALVNGYVGVWSSWYDSVNDRLYIFGYDTSLTVVYTAYIVLETGALTNIGALTFSTTPSSVNVAGQISIHRPAIDSGNFTMFASDRTVVINESTGAEVSNVASTNVTGNTSVGTYVTLDGLILLDRYAHPSNFDAAYISLSRGGNSAFVPAPTVLFTNIGTSISHVIGWGDKVKTFEFGTGTSTPILRTFLRSEFDDWITAIADFGGLA